MATEIESKMRAAGVDVDSARLMEVALDALRKYRGNESKALRSFELTVFSSPELLVALVGREFIVSRLGHYLHQRAADMQGSTLDGASRVLSASQGVRDRPSPAPSESSAASRGHHDGHVTLDRRAAPSLRNDAASLRFDESQGPADRRVTSAPRTKIGKAGAVAMLHSSVYDMRIGTELTFRTARLFDVVNAERAGSRYTRVMTLLRTSKAWPEGATVPQVYSEAELKGLMADADKALASIPTEAIAHVR